MPVARQHNILDWSLCSQQECEGIRGLVWTIEMQSWETDCGICCLANQSLSVRVKCKRACQSKYRLPSVSIMLLLSHTLLQLRMWIGFTCGVIPTTSVWFHKVWGSFTVNESLIISFYRFCLNFLLKAPKFEIVKALMVDLNTMQSVVTYFPKQSY